LAPPTLWLILDIIESLRKTTPHSFEDPKEIRGLSNLLKPPVIFGIFIE
jgi:hypothetical protein